MFYQKKDGEIVVNNISLSPLTKHSGLLLEVRAISPEEIELIQWTVKAYPKLTRYELARTMCEFLGWA